MKMKNITIVIFVALIVFLVVLIIPANNKSVKAIDTSVVNTDTVEVVKEFATTYELTDELKELVTNLNNLNTMTNNEIYQNEIFIDFLNDKLSQANEYVQNKSDEFVSYTSEQQELFVEDIRYLIAEINGYIDYLTDTFDEAITTPLKDSYEKYKESDYFPEHNLIFG